MNSGDKRIKIAKVLLHLANFDNKESPGWSRLKRIRGSYRDTYDTSICLSQRHPGGFVKFKGGERTMKLLQQVAIETNDCLRQTIFDFNQEIIDIRELIVLTIISGKKILTCGNGGSAAQAEHFVGELIGRYKVDREALAAICLNSNIPTLTALGNDYGYEDIFTRPLQALSRPGDILIVFSTSGNSINIVKAICTAKRLEVETVALLGKGGGEVKGISDISIVVGSYDTAIIQSAHLFLFHHFCDFVDNAVKKGG